MVYQQMLCVELFSIRTTFIKYPSSLFFFNLRAYLVPYTACILLILLFDFIVDYIFYIYIYIYIYIYYIYFIVDFILLVDFAIFPIPLFMFMHYSVWHLFRFSQSNKGNWIVSKVKSKIISKIISRFLALRVTIGCQV